MEISNGGIHKKKKMWVIPICAFAELLYDNQVDPSNITISGAVVKTKYSPFSVSQTTDISK